MSDTELEEREQNAGQSEKIDGGIAPGELAALDQIEAGLNDTGKNDEIPYTDEGEKSKGLRRFITKRKTAGGLIIGMLLGGSLGMATITSGPLQFIHIAQLLKRFHFQSVEDTGNSRTLKLYKYAKNKKAGTVENTRLGILGNKLAERIDARYENIGLEKKFSNNINATYEGMQLDPIKFSENAQSGSEFKRLGEEDFIAKFKEKYGVTLVPNGETFTVPPDSGIFAYFKNKNLNGLMSEESGLHNISAGVATRVMGKRDGITWHPIKAADAYLVGKLDQRFSAWVREQKERIKNGNDEPLTATGDPVADENGNPDPAKTGENASAADAATQEGLDAAKSIDEAGNPLAAEESAGLIRQLTESTGGKVALGATAAIGLACLARGITEAAANLKHDKVVLPITRMGMEAMSVGHQTGSGTDMNLEQLSFFARQLYSQKDGSWASARSIQAELGEEQTGPDIPDEANISKIDNKGIFGAILGIPGLAPVCKATESTAGRVISVALSLTTPIATILTTAVTSTPQFKSALTGFIRWAAGGPVPTLVFGATYGNYINYGARFASNHAAASMGGVKLSKPQRTELRNFENDTHKQELQNRSFAERMFDIYSPDSLASKVIDNTSPGVSNNVASVLGTITNPLKVFASFRSPFSAKVSAATEYDYGFDKIGFSLESMTSDTFENPYDNAAAAVGTLAGPNGATYVDRAYKCFGVHLSSDGAVSSDMNAQIDPTNKDYATYNCDDPATDWNQERIYILDTKTAQASDCFEYSDDETCQESGFEGQKPKTTMNDTNMASPVTSLMALGIN